MSLAVAINRSSSEGLGAESKITYVNKLCSRRQPKEMISETNVCTRQSLELESWRRANTRKRDDIRVGQTNKSSVKKRRRREETRKRKKRGGDPKGEVEEKSSEKTRAGRLRKRRGESQSFLIRVAVQESKTRMRNNALRTGPRQAVETAVSKRGYHTGYRHGNY
ncbi:hypothetical protein TNCV_523301 [Trichonephila clavipes]|nr:hypothetical protein TNCV_523301 [Trichonephila clavipes]